MRNEHDQAMAVECLKLAVGTLPQTCDGGYAIEVAGIMLAFVTGTDADDAKHKLDAVRKAVG